MTVSAPPIVLINLRQMLVLQRAVTFSIAMARVRVVFNKAINPITISPSTIQIDDGSSGVLLDSISLSGDTQSVLLTPHAPLPDGP